MLDNHGLDSTKIRRERFSSEVCDELHHCMMQNTGLVDWFSAILSPSAGAYPLLDLCFEA